MADSVVQIDISETKDSSQMITEFNLNGANGASLNPVAPFRVKRLTEKAILPKRASPLSAGYDLSR